MAKTTYYIVIIVIIKYTIYTNIDVYDYLLLYICSY